MADEGATSDASAAAADALLAPPAARALASFLRGDTAAETAAAGGGEGSSGAGALQRYGALRNASTAQLEAIVRGDCDAMKTRVAA